MRDPLFPRASIRDVLEKLIGALLFSLCVGYLIAQIIKPGV